MKGGRIERDIFAETDDREDTFKRCVITPDGWKSIYSLETQARELYDLKTDAGEMKNAAAVEATRADELERKLFAHFKSIGHDLTARRWDVGFNPVYAFPMPDGAKKP